jgi:hypothetical protein
MTAPSTAPPSEAVPDERPYVHQKCGSVTTISGGDFRAICDPFLFVARTVCVHCNEARPLGEFAWADTGENIDGYRARIREMFPGHGQKRGLIGLGLIVGGTILGTLVGMRFVSPRSGAPPVIGCLAGLVLGTVLAVVVRMKHRVDWRRYR